MRKLEQYFTMLLFLGLSSLPVMRLYAQDKYLQVLQKDGQVMSFNLKEEPKTTYSEGKLIITTTKTKISYPLEQVHRFTYSDGTNGIMSTYSMKVTLSDNGEVLTFDGLRPQTSITLYNIAGQLLSITNSDSSPQVKVSVSDLPTGVYIIKVNGVSYKISKR